MSTPNPFQRFHALGYTRLVPIIPPGVDISANSTLFKRMNTPQDGRGKTPGRRNQDGTWGSFDWVAYECDETDLDRWHSMGAGVGIKTGDMGDGTTLVLIDADTKDHAEIVRDRVLAILGPLPVRLGNYPKAGYVCRVRGPFQYQRIEFGQRDEKNRLLDRVEILSDGRQFVAEGVHPKTGKPYAWPQDVPHYAQVPIFEPAQITGLLDDLRPLLPSASEVIVEGATTEHTQASLKGSLDAVTRAVRALPNTHNSHPSRESYRDVGYAIKAALPDEPEAALELFHDWCARYTAPDGSGNDPDVVDADWSRMKGPFRRGASWLFDQAAALGTDYDRADAWFDGKAIDDTPPPEPSPFFDASMKQQEEAAPKILPLVAGRITLDDLDVIPPRQWLYGHKALRKYVTFIASPGGVGKTAFIFAMAIACAAKQRLLHDDPRGLRPLRVWIFNLEDDMDELRRRLKAALAFYNLPPETLDYIRINSGRDRGIKVLKLSKDGDFVVQPDYEAIVAEIEREGIDLLFVDPFLRSHGVPENANEAQDEVMRVFAQIAQRTNCAIILVHHTKKGAIAGDMDSLRGGSTQGGGARAAYTLSPMSIEEAGKFGIPENDRRLYVRIDDAKNNMAPPANKAEWLRLHSVSLGNATEEYVAGDSVQVAGPWEPPSAWEGVLDSEGAILLRLDAGLDDGERYSLRTQDKERWAGLLLIEEFDKNPIQAKEILDAWVAEGKIEARDYKSEIQRKVRKGLFVTTKGQAKRSGVFD